MTVVALAVALALLAGLTVLQSLVIAGRPLGALVFGGQHRVLPSRLRAASGAAIVLYGVFAVLLLSRADVIPLAQHPVVVVGTWVLCAFSALSVGLNALSRSRPERLVQTPVSAVLTLSVLVLAIG